jgi:hypothetical protein
MFEAGGGLLELAQKQVGIVEKPKNSNRTKFGEWFGWNGVAWCAIFISWLFWHVGSPIPALQTKKGGAYVPLFVEHAKKTGQWRSKRSGYRPKPTDLVVFQMTNRPDHIGLVKAILRDGRIWTIEGNTNAAGSRTGGGVWEVYRSSNILGYIEVKPKADWFAMRRWIAGVVFNKTAAVRTIVPNTNAAKTDVITVQEALNVAMNVSLKTDGKYGPITKAQMTKWQANCLKMGLPMTDPLGSFGDHSKWWLCVALKNIRDGKA